MRARDAPAHGHVLDGEARVIRLHAVAVVPRIDDAVLDLDVLRLDVEPVVVAVAVAVDRHAARRDVRAALEDDAPAGRVAQGEALQPDALRVGEEEAARPLALLVAAVVLRNLPRRAVAEDLARPRDGHVRDIQPEEDRAPRPLGKRQLDDAVVLQPRPPFEDGPLRQVDLDIAPKVELADEMPPRRNRHTSATPRRRRVNGALPLRRLVRMRDRQAERKASSHKTDLLHLFLLT